MIPSHWKLIGGLLLVLALILTIGGVYASQQRRIGQLERDIARTVEVISEKDKQMALERGEFTRTLADAVETIKAIRTPSGGTVIIRETTRPPAPAPTRPQAGQPTPPAVPQTGKPLIPKEKVEESRAAASERIRVGFDPGHLVDCPTPGLDPDEIELIRDQTGRLLSPSPCVARISDQVNLREPPARSQARQRGRFKATLGYGFNAGIGYGVSFELLKIPIIPVTLDAVAIVSPSINLGPGAAWRINDAISVGGSYLYGTTSQRWGPWVTFSYRP